MKLSIIIPVFHEEKNIGKVLKQISAKVTTQHQTLIVYDTPEDPTYTVVKDILHTDKTLRLVRNTVGNGCGVLNAILTGIEKANSQAVVIVMADLSDDITNIDAMYHLIEQGYDIVNGSRYMKGGKKIGGPKLKTFLSRTAGISLHYLLRIPTHDVTNAFKMYRKTVFNTVSIESIGGFEYSLEVLVKAYKQGYKVTEIPTVWKDRTAGKSQFQFRKWLPHYIRWFVFALKP